MGKHHTYRKRGSVRPDRAALPVPYAPTLGLVDDELTQSSGAATNNRGTLNIYLGPTESGPWSLWGTHVWVFEYGWSDIGDAPVGYYYCEEIGNNSTWFGTSQPSNIFHNS
jgi:hypothetical protein